VLFHLKSQFLVELHRQIGQNFKAVVMPSIVYEVLKSVVALYSANELIEKRENVCKQIRKDLQNRCQEFFMQLDEISLMGIHFGAEYHRAIESKQVA